MSSFVIYFRKWKKPCFKRNCSFKIAKQQNPLNIKMKMNSLVLLFNLSHFISLLSHPIYANMLLKLHSSNGKKYTQLSKFREIFSWSFLVTNQTGKSTKWDGKFILWWFFIGGNY